MPRACLTALGVAAVLAVGATGSATAAPEGRRVPPEVFARVVSGVGLVRSTVDCAGKRVGHGTAFLVGSQLVVTANHGVELPDGRRSCRLQVRLSGRWYNASYAKAWYDDGAARGQVDLATLKLDRPAPGYVFGFAAELPPAGATVAAIGHPFGLPVSFQQGLLRRTVITNGVPTTIARMLTAGGNSGGPIINRDGEVVSIVQRSAYPEEDPAVAKTGLILAAGLDLTRWFGVSAANDLCRAYPHAGIPNCESDVSGPARRRWISLRPRAN